MQILQILSFPQKTHYHIRLLSAKLPNNQVGGGWSESSCGFFRKHLSFGGQKPAAGGRKIGIWWMENRSDAVPRERFSRQMTTRNGIDAVAARVSDIVEF